MADETINNTIKTTVELDVAAAQQEIVKLNSLASDSTEDLSKRVDAKNKQVSIQNDLNKKAITDAEKLVKGLEGQVGKEKDLEKAMAKLNKAKLNEVKVNTRNEKAQKKLNSQYANSKGAVNKLNKATGGFIDKLKLLAADPIVLFVTILVGALTLLQKAFVSSEEGQDKWAKGMAIISTLLGNLMDVVSGFANILVDAFLKPQEAWDGLIGALKTGYDIWKTQVFDRWVGNLKIFTGGFEKGILKMRIAWNNFTGDSDEADKLTEKLGEVNKKIEEGYEAHNIANQQLVDGYNAAKKAVTDFIDEQGREIKISNSISDSRAKADRLERDLIVERAKANRDRAAALEKSVDKEKFTIEERIALLKEAGQIEQDITDKEIIAARLRLDAKVKENALANSTKEDLVEEAELRAKIINLETARLTKQKEVTGQIQAFNAENKAAQDKIIADKKAEDDKAEADRLAKVALDKENAAIDREQAIEQDQLELERKRELGLVTLEDELAFLEKKREQDVSAEGLRQSEIDTINRTYAAEAQSIREYEQAQSKAKDEAILNSAIGAIGEAFGASKEISIASALINTYKGISEVWGAKSETGLVGAGFVQKVATSGLVALQGFNTVKKIVGTKAPGVSGGGGGGGGIPSIAAPAIPTATATEIDDLTSRNESRTGIDTSLGNQATATASANVSATSSGNVVFSEAAYNSFQDQVQFREDKSTL